MCWRLERRPFLLFSVGSSTSAEAALEGPSAESRIARSPPLLAAQLRLGPQARSRTREKRERTKGEDLLLQLAGLSSNRLTSKGPPDRRCRPRRCGEALPWRCIYLAARQRARGQRRACSALRQRRGRDRGGKSQRGAR